LQRATIRKATVTRKPDHRGEREISRKTIVQGKPDATGEPVVLPPCFFCTGPTGASDTRLSLRPLFSGGTKFMHNSGASRRGIERARIQLFENRTIKSVNRLVYDLDVKAAGTIEWE
jgi:hypothetical protein